MTGTFPTKKYDAAGDLLSDYMERLHEASKTVDHLALQKAAEVLIGVFEKRGILYVCGNGGSAAISNHMTCDVMKGVQTDTDISPRIVSLSSNVEIITAIGNDIEFAEIFAYQLKSMLKENDALVTISSSGNSENIIRAVNVAQQAGVQVISMTGFDGGRSAKQADINLHVQSDNYGIIEDLHQSLMHVLAQYMRQSRMTDTLIAERKF